MSDPLSLDQVRLVDDLARLGLASGRDVLVHSSLRRVGSIAGGPTTLLAALRAAIGPVNSVVVSAQTPNNSTTSRVHRIATNGLNEGDRAEFEANMRGFDPSITPSHGMGILAEHVRLVPGSLRSSHPQTSFAAIGPTAAGLLAVHDLDSHLGERSPLAALYEADASILLLGVGYEVCTALHLAEYRLRPEPMRTYRCFVERGGRREQLDFTAVQTDASDFARLGLALDGESFVRIGRVGNATARAIPLQATVDFALTWMTYHRPAKRSGRDSDAHQGA